MPSLSALFACPTNLCAITPSFASVSTIDSMVSRYWVKTIIFESGLGRELALHYRPELGELGVLDALRRGLASSSSMSHRGSFRSAMADLPCSGFSLRRLRYFRRTSTPWVSASSRAWSIMIAWAWVTRAAVDVALVRRPP